MPQPGPGEQPVSPGDAVRQGLRALATGAWLALAWATVPQLFRPGGQTAWTWAGAVLMACHQLVVLCGLVLQRGRRTFRVATVLLWASFLLLLPLGRHITPANQWAPGYLALPWTIWATLVLPGRRHRVVAGGTIAVMAVLDAGWVLAHPPVAPRDLMPSLWIPFPPLVALFFGDGLRQMAARVEAEVAERAASGHLAEQRRHELHARAEAARLLHDHLLHALHALARVGEGVDEQMARSECAAALAALDEHPEDQATSVRDLLDADPMVAATGAVVTGDVGELPADIAHALAAATHEALTNVQRHARATSVLVELSRHADHHQVVVTDDGTGFSPERVPEERLGVRRSIRARLDDVGGAAVIESRPGRGTRVVLSWPRAEAEPQWWTTGSHRLMRRLLVRTSWPGLMVTAAAVPLMAPATGGWAMTLVALLQVAVGVGQARALRRRPPSRRDAVVVLAASVLGWYATLALAPDIGRVTDIYDLWPVGAAPALLHLVVLQLPIRTGAALVGGWSVLMVAGLLVRYPTGFDWMRLNPLVSTGIGEGVLTLAALAIFQRLSHRHVVERRAIDRSRLAMARMRHDWHATDYWSRRATGEALPLLRAAAHGSGPLDEPATRRHARLLETTLRDELLLGPEQTAMLATLGRLRQAGWTVPTPAVADGHGAALARMAPWIGRIGPPAHPGQELRVTVSRGRANLVVLDPAPDQLDLWRATAAELGADLDEGPGFARLRATLPPGTVT